MSNEHTAITQIVKVAKLYKDRGDWETENTQVSLVPKQIAFSLKREHNKQTVKDWILRETVESEVPTIFQVHRFIALMPVSEVERQFLFAEFVEVS